MNTYTIKKNIFWDIAGVILLKLLLEYSYVSFITIYYDYMGFDYEFNLIKYIEGWIIYIILFLLLYIHKSHLLYMTLLISFLILIPPTTILYAFKNEPASSFYSIVLPYALMLLLVSKKRIKLLYFPYGKTIAITLSVLIVFTVLLHYLKTVGLSNINLDLNKVYELRRSDLALMSNAGIFGYLNSWATKVLNIFLIAVALLHRRYFTAALLIFVQVLLFGFSGHKGVLFSLLLLAGLYLFDRVKNKTAVIIYSMLIVVLATLLYFHLFNEQMIPSILIRRVFFVPANLNYVYIEYFTNHDYLYWSNSILKSMLTYPYEVSPVFVIGDYLGFPDMAANTGIFGSGYMHLGIVGIIIYIFISVAAINTIQGFSRIPVWVINSIVLMPLLSLFISSDLFTTFLTHGLFAGLLVLYLYSTPRKDKVN